ncbi:hypothetical protein L2E82_02376 [Cichorium intybus]|uniref:Uncharacterized protein n=1 Tax=Cichorium intybus TaxID=13427 RepID=A0ACB9H248_CICIN|nr:hypothetical protein L1887_03865 [Cichorium endivia]KAI3789576.1 hypothetical protein L2E82_02376 [Cichorium intybus]
MKISSKSILSPGRAGVARDPPNSLSTSLSRRLRNSGSTKGGASPAMFPTTAKKRGSFENPEPSSPKVTCIGQVRVKSKKKQAKKLRTLSRRHSTGEVSFRNVEHPLNGFASKTQNLHESLNLGSSGTQNQNQEYSPPQRSWVHFPVTICDALRAFGSEFSCLFPCRKDEKTVATEGNRQASCGAVFARWLVTVQDGDGGGQRDIELVVGEEEEEEKEEEIVVKKSRRHVFEDLEIINDRIEGHKDETRVSICVPPKNALLLMRCRSDPMKLEALTHRSWEPTVAKSEEEDEERVDHEDQIEQDLKDLQQVTILDDEQENVQQDEAIQDQEQENVQQDEAIQDQERDNVQQVEAIQYQERDDVQQVEAIQDQEHENVQQDEANRYQEENVQQDEANRYEEHDNVQQDEVGQDQEEERLFLESLFEENVNQDEDIQEHDDDSGMEEAQEEVSTLVMTEVAEISETHEEEMVSYGVLERESEVKEERESEKVLPECLLMMMYEPKLSMEVSKETWVCSTDFIRRNSNRRKPPPPPPVKTDTEVDSRVNPTANATATVNNVMRVVDGGRQPSLQQPARSSCSFPAPPSMATMLEKKLADAMGYEPFVLTRCKSEPMKTAAAKLLPESCLLENSKLERLSRGTFGVGAAGLGF